MAISYVQTDTSAPAGTIAACSGKAVQNAFARLATVGGSAGSTQVLPIPRVDRVSAMVEIVPASGVTWAAGEWTVPFNCTQANANVTLDGVYICRLNSSDVSQATIGSTTSIGTVLSSTGVTNVSVTGSAQTPSVGDKVYILYGFLTTGSPEAVGWTPDQTIVSPFTVPAADDPGRPAIVRLHSTGMMMGNLGRYYV